MQFTLLECNSVGILAFFCLNDVVSNSDKSIKLAQSPPSPSQMTSIKSLLFLALSSLASASLLNSCGASGKFALTFDGGPGPLTGRLLTALRERSAHATFHITTMYLEQPVLLANIRQAVADGHVIGLTLLNSNLNIPTVTPAAFKDAIIAFRDRISKFVGVQVVYLRFPSVPVEQYQRLISVAEEEGFIVTGSNFDFGDYQADRTGNTVFSRFKAQLDLIAAPAKGTTFDVLIDFQETTLVLPLISMTIWLAKLDRSLTTCVKRYNSILVII